MRSYRTDPMDRALCGWGTCTRPACDNAPLCRHHLLRAWAIVHREKQLFADMLAEQYEAREPLAPAVPASLVYYFRSHRGIKIGRSVDLANRMAALMVAPDDVLACEPGDHRKETFRHRQFAELRIPKTEYFRVSQDLLDHVQEIRATFGDPWDLAESLRKHRGRVALDKEPTQTP